MKQLSIYDTDNFSVNSAEPLDDLYNSEAPSPMPAQALCEKVVTKLPVQQSDSALNRSADYHANVTEIIVAKNKTDSIQMLLPMLNNLSQEKRWLAWIDPPIQLLKQWQDRYDELATEEIMILRSSESNSAYDLSKRALEAGTCHAVIAWTETLSQHEFDQLEKASATGNSHGIILRNR